MQSLKAEQAVRRLGEHIRIARLKRRLGTRDFARRMGTSESTLARLERGEPGTSIGTIAMALLVLGEIHRLEDLLEPATDATGLVLDREALPKRIDKPRRKRQDIARVGETRKTPEQPSDDEGMGF
jgi:transcriptional regulator with XRE-family HTH domain